MAHSCSTELPGSCFLLDAELRVGSFCASPCSAVQTSLGVPKLQDKNSSFLLARILHRHVHTLSAEHVSSSTDLHGAIHMLEPLHIWEQGRGGHWVLCLPALHTTPGDPTQKRECSRMALSYTAIFISISHGLAETCYELS